MKNLVEFGKALSRAEQRVINGGDPDAPKCLGKSCSWVRHNFCIGPGPVCD